MKGLRLLIFLNFLWIFMQTQPSNFIISPGTPFLIKCIDLTPKIYLVRIRRIVNNIFVLFYSRTNRAWRCKPIVKAKRQEKLFSIPGADFLLSHKSFQTWFFCKTQIRARFLIFFMAGIFMCFHLEHQTDKYIFLDLLIHWIRSN